MKMQQFMEQVRNIVEQYENELAEKGIACSVSKKYFETDVSSVAVNNTDTLHILYVFLANKRENKNFRHQRNRTHCAVICFYPTDTQLLKKKDCKEYAFAISKIFRFEEGVAPKKQEYNQKDILKKIEKRILRVLKAAEKKNIDKICRESFSDKVRYKFSSKYAYR